MAVFSQSHHRAKPGLRDDALKAYRTHRVLEDCANAIPGLIHGFLLASREDADAFAVVAEWADQASLDAWLAHPLRQDKEDALSALVEPGEKIVLFDSID